MQLPGLVRPDSASGGRTPASPGVAPIRAGARLGLANGLALVIGVAAAPVLSRLFPPSEYGRFASYAALIALLASVLTGRFELGVFGQAGRARRFDFTALGVGSAIVLAVAAWVIAGVASLLGVISGPVARTAVVVATGALLVAVLAAMTALRVASEHYDRNATARVAQSGAQNAVQILLGLSGARSASALVAGLLAGLATAASLTGGGNIGRIARRMHPARWMRLQSLARAYRALPLRSAPAALVIAASLQLPVLIVTLGAGAARGGELSMAQRLLGAPMLVLGMAVGQVALGTCARVASSAPHELPGLVARLLRALLIGGALLTTFLVGALVMLAEPFLGLAWGGVAWMALVLAPFALAQFVGSPLLGLLHVVRRQDLEMTASLYRLAGIAPLCLVLILPAAVLPAVLAYSLLTALAYGAGLQILKSAVRDYAGNRAPVP